MTFPWPLSTDQNTCYGAEGTPVSCEASGQDAEGKSNDTQDDQRFRLDGDTVFDTRTGLHWSRNANPFEFPYTWREAFGLIDEMNRSSAHGRNDWRLPSRRELFSLVSHQHINPALPESHPFHDVFNGYYWTATPCARLPDQAWYVHLGGARIYRGMQKGAYLAWPVAGPELKIALHTDRFRVKDAIVEDRWTGLCWTHTARTSATLVTWEEALKASVALNQDAFGGRANWRLPNIRELESLVDLARHSPALPAGHPFEDVQDGYWSSTSSVYEARYAWVLYMQDGAVGVGFKRESTFSAWAVTRDKPTHRSSPDG